ncbi:MAG: ATP-binding protein [Gammaproteobacteria bacterium]|nr:ATP-binding protein [Gammaproteobacteria bacterium]
MDYFPLTVTKAPAFCNRKNELKRLSSNIQKLRPTLIVSPRRYGKTSLAINSINKAKLWCAKFDLLSVTDEEDIKNVILHGVGNLLVDIEKGVRKALRVATELFAGLNIKISVDTIGLSLEASKSSSKPAYEILTILERVEKIAQKHDKKIILFFDEFQRVMQVTEDSAIESVIREVAQLSNNLVFIFTGSNRHLLHKMFDDRDQPFYKLCDRITINRIAPEEYIPYIQHAAQERWNKSLEEIAINRIFELTERHPYYLNILCSRLWDDKICNTVIVEQEWHRYLQEEKSQVGAELDLLSKNQRKLLAALARHNGTNAPRSYKFQELARMSGSSISQTISTLEKKDYIYQNEAGYYNVLDPLIKAVLSKTTL